MSVRISRQHWEGLLGELDQARRQRHLLTYRALLERLQLPSPAMQTLTAALEHLAALDAKAEQPLRSSLVISQGASRLPRTGVLRMCRAPGTFFRPLRWCGGGVLACFGSGTGVTSTIIPSRPRPDLVAYGLVYQVGFRRCHPAR